MPETPRMPHGRLSRSAPVSGRACRRSAAHARLLLPAAALALAGCATSPAHRIAGPLAVHESKPPTFAEWTYDADAALCFGHVTRITAAMRGGRLVVRAHFDRAPRDLEPQGWGAWPPARSWLAGCWVDTLAGDDGFQRVTLTPSMEDSTTLLFTEPAQYALAHPSRIVVACRCAEIVNGALVPQSGVWALVEADDVDPIPTPVDAPTRPLF